jgi:flavin reductase (DIM6/NTAB) family NADH-FMN oxidoreductase RutF/DNA-binding IclR family transcriptional regulator
MSALNVHPQDMRRALAHYPTGVAVLLAHGPDGSPTSMVVGTFTSVSLDPPLVGFLADRNSASWRAIKEAGHFCVSVLGAAHEHVCRAFATKDPDRFQYATALTGQGRSYIDDAPLWVDCEIADVLEAGDHDFVLGSVQQLGVSADEPLPLLFLRGGYGAPRIASLQVEAPGLAPVLRLADAVRPEIEAVSHELDVECVVLAAVGDEVVMIAAAGIDSPGSTPRTHVGSAFPLAAPLAALFVAWASPGEQQRWLRDGCRLAGTDLTESAVAALETVRAQGYETATGTEVSERFRQTVVDSRGDTAAALQPAMRAVVENRSIQSAGAADELANVTMFMVPVHGHDGRVVLNLGIVNLTGKEDRSRLQRYLDRLLLAAENARHLILA